jgi:hypothetical protein
VEGRKKIDGKEKRRNSKEFEKSQTREQTSKVW